jgi:glycosyltransferase involved in cell wall biosynthesis
MDVFALTSRSDSFPLAAIEAGLLGVPIVCFEKASGIQEIIQQGGGEVVPYLDIQKMADAIIHLVTSDELRLKKSEEVKKLFESCKPDVISNEIAIILTKLLK